MKRMVLAAGVLLWSGMVQGAGPVPAQFSGAWGTSQTLYDGKEAQTALHLAEDGLGLLAGSSAAPAQVDSESDATPPPRAIVGFPVRATAEGDTLTLQPFLPGNEQAEKTAGKPFNCRYDAAGPALRCTGLDGKLIVMRRNSESLPEEAVQALDAVRKM